LYRGQITNVNGERDVVIFGGTDVSEKRPTDDSLTLTERREGPAATESDFLANDTHTGVRHAEANVKVQDG
jgi:hypothetical protein